MAATLEAARRVGFSRVELNVYRSNTDAIRLYQKAGFVLKAVQPREARDDGFDKTLLVMALALDTGR